MKYPFLFALAALLFAPSLEAKHLVGGDLRYRCTNVLTNTYEITLELYRDCNSPTDFDPSITTMGIFGAAPPYDIIDMLFMGSPTVEDIPNTSSDPCVPPPTDICYSRAVYKASYTFPFSATGYYVSWGRCCRNPSISNIETPEASGMILSVLIPASAYANNSPAFKNSLPTFTCVGASFVFDHSATEADGDSLVYAITTPFNTTSGEPTPQPVAPPYNVIQWGSGFGPNNPLGNSAPMSIDPKTGVITAQPNQLGQFVFSVSVFEYRNGVLLSEIKRDIQLNVIYCPINQPPEVTLPAGEYTSGDTLFFRAGSPNCRAITIGDLNGPGLPADQMTATATGNMFGTGAVFAITKGPAPQTATLCWQPRCAGQAGVGSIVVTASDNNACPAPNIITKTIYFKILPTVPPAPILKSAEIVSENAIQITWEPLAMGDKDGFVSYNIGRTDSSGIWATIAQVANSASDSYTDPAAFRARTSLYAYRIATEKICPGPIEGENNEPVYLSPAPTLFLPTVFSPNGDDHNDVFVVKNMFARTFFMAVYDRWGKLIFESDTVEKGWDGTSHGVVLPEGAYLYTVHIIGYHDEVKQYNGTVLLMR